MEKNVSYREVSIDGMAIDRNYKNPMTKVFQYEYALYLAVSALFQSVRCKSMCIGSLMLYYMELSKGVKDEENQDTKETAKRSQKKLLEEMEMLVAKNVIGNISFPMMNVCAAEVYTRLEKDGTHTFIFTDGIYGFSVHLDMFRKDKFSIEGLQEIIGLSREKPIIAEPSTEYKPLAKVEELEEQNYNQIDNVLNNMPKKDQPAPAKPKPVVKQEKLGSVLKEERLSLLERMDVMQAEVAAEKAERIATKQKVRTERTV